MRFPGWMTGLLLVAPVAAVATTPFDGKWQGKFVVCGGVRSMAITVEDGRVSGLEEWPGAKSAVAGKIAPATGAFEGNIFGQGEFNGKFAIDSFAGSYLVKCPKKTQPAPVTVILKPQK